MAVVFNSSANIIVICHIDDRFFAAPIYNYRAFCLDFLHERITNL